MNTRHRLETSFNELDRKARLVGRTDEQVQNCQSLGDTIHGIGRTHRVNYANLA